MTPVDRVGLLLAEREIASHMQAYKISRSQAIRLLDDYQRSLVELEDLKLAFANQNFPSSRVVIPDGPDQRGFIIGGERL